MSPEQTLPQVAVLRASAPPSIELWNPQHDWAIERVITGQPGDNFECVTFVGPSLSVAAEPDSSDDEAVPSASVPVSVFAAATPSPPQTRLNQKHVCPLSVTATLPRARLLSAGVDGRIREWNTADGGRAELFSVDANGGAIWCMAVSPDQETLAVGCEDGRIRLFSIYARSVEFLRGFELTNEGRVQSLSWDATGTRIVSGSAGGFVRLWNVQTGRPVHSIALDRVRPTTPTSVAAVLLLPDGTFVTGDSMGHMQFWDSVTGTRLQSFPALRAPILAIAGHANQVFVTGIDHKIVEFTLVASKNAAGHETTKWIEGGSRRYHTHDVRTLALGRILQTNRTASGDTLVWQRVLLSGGVDCALVASDPTAYSCAVSKSTFNLPQRCFMPLPRHQPRVQLASHAPVLAGHIDNAIEVWSVGRPSARHLASVRISRFEPIVAFAVSPAAHWLAVLTSGDWRLFRLPAADEAIARLETLPELPCGKTEAVPHLAVFASDHFLLLFTAHSILRIAITGHETADGQLTAILTDTLPLASSPALVRRVTVNPSGTLVAVEAGDRVSLYALTKRHIRLAHTLPAPAFALTAIAFTAEQTLTVADCRNALLQYDCTSGHLLGETHASLSREWLQRREPIMGIAAHPVVAGRMSCWTDGSIGQTTLSSDRKRRREQNDADEGSACRIINDHPQMLLFAHLPNGDSVVVERPWMSIVEQFPPAFHRVRYGAQ